MPICTKVKSMYTELPKLSIIIPVSRDKNFIFRVKKKSSDKGCNSQKFTGKY